MINTLGSIGKQRHTQMYGIIDLMKKRTSTLASSRAPVRATRRAPADRNRPAQTSADAPGRNRGAAREALTPEAWIEAATEVLVGEGIDHVRVDVLARQLGVTRGSFYWHFRDREDLLRRVLQAWSERATLSLTRRLASASDDPRERLRDMISLPHRGRSAERAARIELAIRAWARRDDMARQALDEADRSRLDYHEEAFRALGLDPVQARARAFITYAYEVGESMLHHHGNGAARDARRDAMERLVTGEASLAQAAAATSPASASSRSSALENGSRERSEPANGAVNRAAKTPRAPATKAAHNQSAARGSRRGRSDG